MTLSYTVSIVSCNCSCNFVDNILLMYLGYSKFCNCCFQLIYLAVFTKLHCGISGSHVLFDRRECSEEWTVLIQNTR